VHQADLLATMADIVGAALPPTAGEDSVNILPLLEGRDEPVRRSSVSQSMRGLLSIRRQQWKLILGPGSGGWAKGRDAQAAQLYDLETDLAETTNLYSQRPRVAAELTELMATTVERGRSTPEAPQTNDVPVRWRRFLDAATKQP